MVMEPQNENEKLARTALWVQAFAVVWCVVAAATSTSVTLMADAVSALLDMAGCLLAYGTVRLERGTYRALLDYGFGKLETLATLFVGLLSGGGAAFVLYDVFEMLANPQPLTGAGIWSGLIGSCFIGAFSGRLWWQLKRRLRTTQCVMLTTQIHVQRIGFFTALGVSVPLACSLIFDADWVRYLDILIAVVLFVFTAVVGLGMIRRSLGCLLDQALTCGQQSIINRHLAQYFDAYEMLDKVRSRTSGADVFIEIFLNFHPNRSIGDIQVVLGDIKGGIEREIPGSQVIMVAGAME
jgi:divalent metal cation (Fe/Co/Zn/Cd) transporter